MLIRQYAELFRKGHYTPSALIETCLQHIERYEPKVHAWVSVDETQARNQAAQLTQELRQGHDRGPLHGIPVGIKDVFDIEGQITGAGVKDWSHTPAREDAWLVGKLRQLGAIILGKTVTTPYAAFDPSVTRNPWDIQRTPGGSSSGSAAAVATGMCLAAIGTQTGGSITRPAAYCSVCSCKPTYGTISLAGVVPLAPSFDHAGFMAENVADLRLFYEAILGPLPEVPLPQLIYPTGSILSKTTASVRQLVHEIAERVNAMPTPLPQEFDSVLTHHRTIMTRECAWIHGSRLAKSPSSYPPKISAFIEEGLRVDDNMMKIAKAFQGSFTSLMDRYLHNAVAILPATLDEPPLLDSTGDPSLNSPWSFTGQPTISVPIVIPTETLPVSVQLVAARGQEASLFAAAQFIEEKAGWLMPPYPNVN